jgi:hypothetical protein
VPGSKPAAAAVDDDVRWQAIFGCARRAPLMRATTTVLNNRCARSHLRSANGRVYTRPETWCHHLVSVISGRNVEISATGVACT